ncbi:uncharacterized protein LOC142182266 [Nicotiana tabacum]|uniref:Uncharacterized protein LOC142182266 n=1 Tax=Nicotiana tabacum TaxID=4097 RepID=A0AC58USQ6_TOBAC
MDPLDEEKTSFIKDIGTYCYKVMPLGLKNVGATYYSLVTKILQEHLGKTFEVYIDDMLVKSQQAGDHIQHLSDIFQILRKFNMKLNPEKCEFGVLAGKFLGFLVSNCGIEVNPAQIKAIEEIPDILTSKKEVQRLTERIPALGRFVSKSLEKCFKFFSSLKKQNQFEWSEECQQALKNLKAYLSNPPLLAKPKDGEKLLIYLTVSKVVVSAVLVRKDQGKQSPIYYVSKSLLDAETRYPHLEKYELALIMASRKLRPYFQCHLISVVTTYPLHNILHKQELSEFSQGIQAGAEKELQVFNKSNPAIKCHPITNNEAEYEVVIAGLELARELEIEQVIIKSDSQLVVNQMQGTYIPREARMQQYLEKARDLVRQFQTWKITQIPREENFKADTLANLASAAEVTNEENASYGILSEDKKKAQALRQKAARYCLDRGNLYRKMFGGPLARCLGPSQIEYVIKEIHEGNCGNHTGGKSLIQVFLNLVMGIDCLVVEVSELASLKKRLEESKGKWPEVLPGILWAYRTTAKTSTRETSFSLVYDAKALIPVEIGEPSTRYTQAIKESNEEEMRVNLDLLEERRETALIRMAAQNKLLSDITIGKLVSDTSRLGTTYSKKFFNPQEQPMQEC